MSTCAAHGRRHGCRKSPPNSGVRARVLTRQLCGWGTSHSLSLGSISSSLREKASEFISKVPSGSRVQEPYMESRGHVSLLTL